MKDPLTIYSRKRGEDGEDDEGEYYEYDGDNRNSAVYHTSSAMSKVLNEIAEVY